ncbi:DUF5916 domain-containing protein [Gaoshiqia sediminis]|uniref:Carbohydrate binding family 9 domain-containing protein n=1 Tax=Gaoshiqia sediminis TaxID=2986998 RepID=A0AA41Y5H1_9BACT|nr:DUF5916 domain-containing protein [Gaoshiqia sediminis]MCW0482205.1 carbohydrate binding family 9 domain-containing protein [Gaoshiqia sediminis]
MKSLSQPSAAYSLSTDAMVNEHASHKKVYYATRVSERPKIDGQLDDACWLAGNWGGGFIQQQPLQAAAPTQKTEICILYDNDNLYVAVKCYDNEPEKIRPILSRRDEFSGDIAGIAIDSYADKRTAFEFNVSAAGQKLDLMHLGSYEWDFNWDAVWDGKSSVQDSMWVAEMRIPFSQLRFAKADEQVWGMHIWRWIDRLQEEDQWKLIPVDAPAMVYLFGELRGIDGINPKRRLEFLPYANSKFSPNTDLKDKWSHGVGMDGKIGLTSDFTLDYTINPDFGQVEADPSVLTLSSYEVFYDEKRPFFLEGNNILDYSMGRDLLFYSRRIGHAPSYTPDYDASEALSMPENTSIISALKLTGKSKKGFSLGVVQSFTASENASIYGSTGKSRETIEPFSSYFVGRVKQDFNEGNTVLGGMMTSVIRNIEDDQLDFLPTSSVAGGLDFKHNWNKRKYYLGMKSFYSQVNGSEDAINQLQLASQHYFQRPDAGHLDYDATRTSLSGHGGEIQGGKRSGKFRATGSFSWRSPGVDLNDLGYMYQADFLEESVQLRYQVNKPKGILRDYWFRLTQLSAWSYGGEKNKQEIGSHAYLRFKNLWSLHYNLERDFGLYDTRELRGGPTLYKESTWDGELFVQSNSAKDLFVAFGSRFVWGDDLISERNINTFQVSWQLSDNFSVSSKTVYSTNTDFHQYAGRVSSTEDSPTRYIVGQIDQKTLESTLRVEYFLTPELSLQYYASPYASVGKYSRFRRVADGSSKNLDLRYVSLTGDLNNAKYTFSDGDQQYTLTNPDFNFQEFNSNLVARWEFRPGSTVYLVWNSSMSKNVRVYQPSVTESFGDIFGMNARHVFMLKFTYWFSL